MSRKFIALCLTVLAVLTVTRAAQAIPISKNNPYRSYSITGLSYGAVQWELEQRRKAGVSTPVRTAPVSPPKGRLFRRR